MTEFCTFEFEILNFWVFLKISHTIAARAPPGGAFTFPVVLCMSSILLSHALSG